MMLHYQWFFPFYGRIVFYYVDVLPFFLIHSPTAGHLGLADANRAAMHIHEQSLVWPCFLFQHYRNL